MHGLILARGGSKGIPRKNIKPLNGVPLLVYNVKAALASGVFDVVCVSSEDAEIRDVAQKAGATVHVRSAASASDNASSEDGIRDYLSSVHVETLTLIQCTSPLTSADDFKRGAELFKTADSLVTVVRTHRFLWTPDGKPKNYDPAHRPRRQDWDGELIENGAFYMFKVDLFKKTNSRLPGKVAVLEMSEDTLVEIDSLTDWAIVEFLAADKFRSSDVAV